MPIMLVLVVVVTSSAPSCLFIPRSYGYAKLSFLVPSPPFPPPGRTIPSRRGHKSKLLTPSAIRNPGLIRSSPPSVRLSLGSAPERVNPSQRCGWRISSGRATSAAGRRQEPQGELLLLPRFSFCLFLSSCCWWGCVFI